MSASDTQSQHADPPRRRWGPDTRPLQIPEYRRLFLGSIITVLGSSLTAVAVQQEIYSITRSSAWVGIASMFALVPLIVFGLLGGAIADTYDRRKLLIITSSGIAVTTVLLWLQSHLQLRSVIVICLLLALQQGFFAVNMPTRSAIIPRIVPPGLIPSANALGSTVFAFGVLFGPLLAGMLMPAIGLSWLYLIDAAALVLAMYAVIRLPPVPPLDKVGSRAKVGEGLAFLRTKPLLLMTFVVDIIAMVFGLPRALFPQMAQETFGGPPEGGLALGLLNAAMAIGVLVGGLTSGWIQRVHRQGVAIILSICLWGVSIALLGTTSVLWLAVIYLAIGGWADLVSASYRSTILQLEAEDRMRGRLQGVFTVVVAGGPRLADMLHGLAAEWTSTTVTIIGGGILTVILTVIASWLAPSLWRYDVNRRTTNS